MKTINLNDFVKVKLTNAAKLDRLKQHTALCDKTGRYLEPRDLADSDGFYCTQIWGLFDEFKDFMGAGKEMPFVDGKIYIDEKYLQDETEKEGDKS